HMGQHPLVTVVVAPMVWLAAPEVPLFVGLPRRGRSIVLAFTKGEGGRGLTRWLLPPGVGWIAFALSFWVWHAPALYDLALESHFWHHIEHACFLGSALLFWRPVVPSWPALISGLGWRSGP